MPAIGAVVTYLDVGHLLAATAHTPRALIELDDFGLRARALQVEGRARPQLLNARSRCAYAPDEREGSPTEQRQARSTPLQPGSPSTHNPHAH